MTAGRTGSVRPRAARCPCPRQSLCPRPRRRPTRAGDAGSAIIEFVFLAVIVMVPLVYVLVAVASVQRTQLAVTQAAREAGRAFATSETTGDAERRVRAAVRLAMTNHGLPDDAEIRFVAAGAVCSAETVAPVLAPGVKFTLCITRHTGLPAVPTVLQGRGVTAVGRYLVHVDDFRAATK
jgi:Flp pilus assembly protein TadG